MFKCSSYEHRDQPIRYDTWSDNHDEDGKECDYVIDVITPNRGCRSPPPPRHSIPPRYPKLKCSSAQGLMLSLLYILDDNPKLGGVMLSPEDSVAYLRQLIFNGRKNAFANLNVKLEDLILWKVDGDLYRTQYSRRR